MLYTVKWLYAWILPPGGFISALALLTIYLFIRRGRGRHLLLLITLFLYLLSSQLGSNLLLKPLENKYPQPERAEGDVVVFLGGGSFGNVPDFDGAGQLSPNAANRLLTAARLQRHLQIPLLLSSGQVFAEGGNESVIAKRALISLGLPERQIVLEDRSRNTAENAVNTARYCTDFGWRRPILVTSAFNMPRAMLFFERAGLKPQPYPCDYSTNGIEQLNIFSWAPRIDCLFNSCLALKEYAGILALKAGAQ